VKNSATLIFFLILNLLLFKNKQKNIIMKEIESGNKEHTISLLSDMLNKLKGNTESRVVSFLVTR